MDKPDHHDVAPEGRSTVNQSPHQDRMGWDYTMKLIHHTAEQIIRKLKTSEQLIAQCKAVGDICHTFELIQPT